MTRIKLLNFPEITGLNHVADSADRSQSFTNVIQSQLGEWGMKLRRIKAR